MEVRGKNLTRVGYEGSVVGAHGERVKWLSEAGCAQLAAEESVVQTRLAGSAFLRYSLNLAHLVLVDARCGFGR